MCANDQILVHRKPTDVPEISYGAPETRREFMAHKLYKFLQKYVQNIDKVSKKHKK